MEWAAHFPGRLLSNPSVGNRICRNTGHLHKDNDNAIEMNEWLAAVLQRFNEADASKDGAGAMGRVREPSRSV